MELSAAFPKQERDAETDSAAEIAGLKAELAQTRNALRDANARLNAALASARVFDSNVVGVIRWNLDSGIITDANDLFLEMVGYTREDLAAGRLNWRKMTPSEWRERNERGVAEIRAGGKGKPYEKEYFRKDGGRVPIVIGGALFENTPNEGMSFILDISEQKRTEAALRESENLYRTLATSASAIIWTAQPDGEEIYSSTAWSAYTGQNLDPNMAVQDADSPVHPDDRDRVVQSWRDAFEQGERWECFYRLWHQPTQSYRFVEAYGVPVYDNAGAITQWVGMVHDVHERKMAEQAQIELNARLRRAMQETHHRIKNNLQLVSALVEMPGRGADADDPALKRIRLHVRNLAAIHDLLTLQARRDSDLSEVSVRAVLNKLIPMLEQTSGGRTFRAEVDDFLLPIREASSLALLVSECVSNALKHSVGSVEITLCVRGEMAILQICDDGAGFPPDFDPATAANTGLELIENAARWDLRGDVAFDNRESGGARVTVTFPVGE